jgi:hypothetical protein
MNYATPIYAGGGLPVVRSGNENCVETVQGWPETAGKHLRLRVHIEVYLVIGSRWIDCAKRCFNITR